MLYITGWGNLKTIYFIQMTSRLHSKFALHCVLKSHFPNDPHQGTQQTMSWLPVSVCSRILPAEEQEGQGEDCVRLYVAMWCTHMTIHKQSQALKLRYNILKLGFGQIYGNTDLKFFKGTSVEESWADN